MLEDPHNDSIPLMRAPRASWHELEIRDAIRGCPVGAISVMYETYRLTADGVEPLTE
jgi:hypothetical protein